MGVEVGVTELMYETERANFWKERAGKLKERSGFYARVAWLFGAGGFVAGVIVGIVIQ